MYEPEAANQMQLACKEEISVTVGENIDLKIRRLEEQIQRLRESKRTLEPLLRMRISDLREAMR